MSIDQLRTDIKENIASLKSLGALTTVPELVDHLKNTLWPTLEAVCDELNEIDGCVEDLMNDQEDILQPETGAKFLACFTAGALIAAELQRRLTASDDPKHLKALAQFNTLLNECIGIAQEITIPEVEDVEDDVDAAEDGTEDDDDEDEDQE